MAAWKASGWSVSRPRSGEHAPDLVIRRGKVVYAVEIKASPGRGRREILRALMADAILQSRAKSLDLHARPLAVLVVPSFSDKIVRELEDYVSRFANGSAFGIVDARGRLELHGNGLDEEPDLDSIAKVRSVRRPEKVLHRQRGSRSSIHDPFSDLGQWMLKVLLSPKVRDRWLNAPRERAHGVADLARIARVSNATASNFLAGLEKDGYIVEAEGELRAARIPALLDAWRRAALRPVEEQPARLLLPASDPERRVRDLLAKRSKAFSRASQPPSGIERAGLPGERACLALFSACHALGVGIVRGSPVHVYSEDLSDEFLAELGLQSVEHPAEAEVVVRRPRYCESVFRACVMVGDVPVADILQCFLDVSFHPARGSEQAAEIAQILHVEQWNA